MNGKLLRLFPAIVFVSVVAMNASAQQARLSAAEVVNRNVAAVGGLQAWRAVQTLTLTGKMQAGGNNRPSIPAPGAPHHGRVAPPRPVAQMELPFKMDLKRARKVRLELQFNGQTAVQVYDGATGWKMRPFLNRTDYEPYTADETKAASEQADVDGPLVDYAAKGTSIALVDMEKVNGQDNYKLRLTTKSGYAFHVWIDAQTFLETKIEGTPRRLDGEYRPIEIYLSDYRQVNGLLIPHVIETKVATPAPAAGKRVPQYSAETIIIDQVVVNPRLDDSLFAKPKSEVATAAPHQIPEKQPAVRQ